MLARLTKEAENYITFLCHLLAYSPQFHNIAQDLLAGSIVTCTLRFIKKAAKESQMGGRKEADKELLSFIDLLKQSLLKSSPIFQTLNPAIMKKTCQKVIHFHQESQL